ncbi:CBS domain-containing protein [Aliiruegeria sabulilitoris]|uniref:CBS domain-containing protein n=1 Tax=Aliiruegeria sabulilitoris TaxID=1510458 RepID=UPI00082C027F|nr:CBS domain-containing protein [Aliiruegeria sabulilitoris]NDR54967.1 CBS domain-containing protein [Pseudoruegeria sp. M32A2M]
MIVQQILKSKGTEGVITVAPGTSVEAAAAVLSEKRIGSVVISEDGLHFEGILSERDIVRELGKRGASCMADTVDDMMTKMIETCGLGDEAESVLGRMTEGRFRHMPVVADGTMIGIITLGDVVKARLTELAMEKDALEGMIMGY